MTGEKAQEYLKNIVTVPADLQKFLFDYANAAKS